MRIPKITARVQDEVISEKEEDEKAEIEYVANSRNGLDNSEVAAGGQASPD